MRSRSWKAMAPANASTWPRMLEPGACFSRGEFQGLSRAVRDCAPAGSLAGAASCDGRARGFAGLRYLGTCSARARPQRIFDIPPLVSSETPFNPREKRTALLAHRGAVIWLTGLSASGKSTLATALERRLLEEGVLAATVDGDVLRSGLSRDLGFSDADRRENIRRAAELAYHFADTGVVAIVALISPFRADRSMAAARMRERNLPFAEVFINAPLATCESRDPKGLYRKARSGALAGFTGIDAPYEPPERPALELRTDRETIEESLAKLARHTLELVRLPVG